MLSRVAWGNLDYLVVDLPPGTSDETVNVLRAIPLDGAVLVTIPSEVSLDVVRRSARLLANADVKIVGIVENMSGYVCPECGHTEEMFGKGAGKIIADEFRVPFLGKIPLDSRIARCEDDGVPFVAKYSEAAAAKMFDYVAEKIVATTVPLAKQANPGACPRVLLQRRTKLNSPLDSRRA